MTATLHFHSFAAKSAFIKRNRFTPSEIISETAGSITILDGMDFTNSSFVYSITK